MTISLPPPLLRASERMAKRQKMTRSEFMRAALRHYLEEAELEEALRVADYELKIGKAKVLHRGGLAAFLGKT